MSSNRTRFLNTYSGKELVKKHSLDTHGTWKILGEDSNPDFGGHHYMPELAYVEGLLGDVIDYAVELPNFWSWGAGGEIVLVPAPTKIDNDTTRKIEELRGKKARLERELAEVVETLNSYGVK